MNFFQTVETDVLDAVHVVEADVDGALIDIWNLAKPVFTAYAPTLVNTVLSAIVAFLTKAGSTQSIDDLEAAFLNEAETLGGELLGQAQGLGSTLLQILIGLAKHAAV